MNKTTAQILDPIVRVFEAKEPALVNWLVTALVAFGAKYGLNLDAAQVAVATVIANGIGSAIVRQLVTATGVAPLPDQPDAGGAGLVALAFALFILFGALGFFRHLLWIGLVFAVIAGCAAVIVDNE